MKNLTLIFYILLSIILSSCIGSNTPEYQEVSNDLIEEENQIPTVNPTDELVIIPTATTELIENIVECAQAQIGENTICKITQAFCSYKPNVKGSPTFCNDAPYPNHSFTLLVWGKDWSKFDGKCLIISGYIHLYKGMPEIEAINESQVEYCN